MIKGFKHRFAGFIFAFSLILGIVFIFIIITDILNVKDNNSVNLSFKSEASPFPSLLPDLIVFVSSKKYSGNLGGLLGADQKCQSLAMDAALPGVYKAWLSGSEVRAIERVAEGNYILLNGQKLGSGKQDLINVNKDGESFLSSGINITEEGEVLQSFEYVWTGTDTSGELSKNCNDWFGGDNLAKGGFAGEEGEIWTDAWQISSCGFKEARLYCFQVGGQTSPLPLFSPSELFISSSSAAVD